MKKILIAEDDKFLASAYKVKLTKANYELKMVSDGKEVFEALKEFVPDIIILDLIMPTMDGFTVLENLKKDDKWKNIPVLVASNLGESEDVVKATKLGAKDYIVKSDLSMKKLIEKIKSIVGESKEEKTVS